MTDKSLAGTEEEMAAAANLEFGFKKFLTDAEEQALKIDGETITTSKKLTPTSDNKGYSFTLKGSEQLTIACFIQGTKYVVKERDGKGVIALQLMGK